MQKTIESSFGRPLESRTVTPTSRMRRMASVTAVTRKKTRSSPERHVTQAEGMSPMGSVEAVSARTSTGVTPKRHERQPESQACAYALACAPRCSKRTETSVRAPSVLRRTRTFFASTTSMVTASSIASRSGVTRIPTCASAGGLKMGTVSCAGTVIQAPDGGDPVRMKRTD